ncbi:MAG: UTP--glucose-1-phosphate uridylyltransferase [Chloroflexota bacterium]
MLNTQPQLNEFENKMRNCQISECVIEAFRQYYTKLISNESDNIDEDKISPIRNLATLDDLDEKYKFIGNEALDQLAILKLNGGMGSSMGLKGPKSLLKVKDGLTFLDIIIGQISCLCKDTKTNVPLILLNSFLTQKTIQKALKSYGELKQNVPMLLLQNRMPKIWKHGLGPVNGLNDSQLEWYPPGHGDLILALSSTGLLQSLLTQGIKYLFISNADNLGATYDAKIFGYIISQNAPFLMEVVHRTLADIKGGHLAQKRSDGHLIIRTEAQCPTNDLKKFQDISRYPYFNTNNLWLHLPTLQTYLKEKPTELRLPMIVNEKPVNPSQPTSHKVYQLESSIGSAVSLFPGAQALCVSRRRFIPVKSTNDLLLIWSDLYFLDKDYYLRSTLEDTGGKISEGPLIRLDQRYFQMIDGFHIRFPYGAPSLAHCTGLSIEGDIRFGNKVVLEGNVQLVNSKSQPLVIPDNSVIHKDTYQ